MAYFFMIVTINLAQLLYTFYIPLFNFEEYYSKFSKDKGINFFHRYLQVISLGDKSRRTVRKEVI